MGMGIRGARTAIKLATFRTMMAGAALSGDPAAKLLGRRQPANPFPLYEQIRKHGDVYRSRLGIFCTVSHAQCRAVLKDPRFGMPVPPSPPAWEMYQGDADTLIHPIERSLLAVNPPEHTRLRRLVAPWFTASALRTRAARVEKIVHSHLDRISDGQDFDLVRDFTAQVPTAVIGDMLGIEIENYEQFGRWGMALATTIDGVRTMGERRMVRTVLAEMTSFFTQLIEENRRAPRDNAISGLVGAEVDGRPVTDDELIGLIGLLLAAGLETTVNLISNSVRFLLEHPEQKKLFLDNPDTAPDVVEEALRYDPPAMFTVRMALEDVELDGRLIPRGGWLVQLLGGANRDPKVFTDPHRFDVTRGNIREHIAFSAGAHHCVGSGLARLEAEIALRELFARFPDMRIAGDVTMRTARSARGPKSIPISVAQAVGPDPRRRA